MITDRNGEPLAVSSPVESLWANPQELLKNPARLPELAQALGVPADELTRKVSQRAGKEFLWLKRRINPDAAHAVLAHNIPGVFSRREFRRFYPQGEALAHVIGFTDIDDSGQEGLELAFDEWLRGTPGAKKVIRDRRGRIVENVDLVKPAQPGRDLTLASIAASSSWPIASSRSACRKPVRAAVPRWSWISPPVKCWRWRTCRPSIPTRWISARVMRTATAP